MGQCTATNFFFQFLHTQKNIKPILRWGAGVETKISPVYFLKYACTKTIALKEKRIYAVIISCLNFSGFIVFRLALLQFFLYLSTKLRLLKTKDVNLLSKNHMQPVFRLPNQMETFMTNIMNTCEIFKYFLHLNIFL